jgi:glycosyltransferase involved in cell wall biosynthesis
VNAHHLHKRVGLQQRVLPAYRAAFFDLLAAALTGGLGVFAGQPRAEESIATTGQLEVAHLFPARNLHFGDPSTPLYLCWQRGLLAWLEAWQPEALIVEANPRYLSTRRAVRWMHARGRPVIGWGLGAPQLRGRLSPLRRWERRSFLLGLDGLIAYSRRGAEEYMALGFPPERVYTAANAAALRPAVPPPQRPPTFQERPVILFVGRLQARKRLDNLLRASAALPPELRPRLWIVGEGPARGEVQALAASIYPEAEFFGDRRGPELEPLFAAADLFVLPGTGGLAVQEAMAHGLPVIVAEGDGTQESLVRPACGWQIPADNLGALTESLRLALADAPVLRRMGAEAYRIVAGEVNLESMVSAFVRALAAVDLRTKYKDSPLRR